MERLTFFYSVLLNNSSSHLINRVISSIQYLVLVKLGDKVVLSQTRIVDFTNLVLVKRSIVVIVNKLIVLIPLLVAIVLLSYMREWHLGKVLGLKKAMGRLSIDLV